MKKLKLLRNELFNLRRGVGLLALALTASLSSCEQGCGFGDEPQPQPQPQPEGLTCSTEVTVVGAGCASGAFQSRWLKLANGELLQPFENKTAVTNIEVGQRFMIGYEAMKPDKRYEKEVICQALPPKGTPVRLHCMTPIEEPAEGCTTIVTARIVECSFGAWGNIWLQLEDGRYLQPWNNGTGTMQLIAGARYKIGFTPMARDNRYDNIVICAAMPSDPMAWNPEIVSVDCLQKVGTN